MKLLLLVTGGRGGSDFFQGLLDGHSQILQFPGVISRGDISAVLTLKNSYEISKKFISTYPQFFNSKLTINERHDRLGSKKNKFYKVSKSKFTKNFVKVFNEKKKLSKINILKDLHIAYDLAKGKKKHKKKIVFVHTHLMDYTKKFLKFIDTKDIAIIHTMRNPLSAINSPVKNWLNYNSGKEFLPINLYYQLDLAFNGITDLIMLKKKIFIVQLEKLNREHKNVMHDFCKKFKIKYEKCLEKSTYFGLQWWGDKISNKWFSGINKDFNIIIDKKIFFQRDINFFECLAEDIIRFYKYDFLIKNKRKTYFNILPMKCELLVWKNAFRHIKIKHILSIPFFYLKRILLINKLVIKNKYFPYSLGSNKNGNKKNNKSHAQTPQFI